MCGFIVTPNYFEALVTESRGRRKTRNFHKQEKYEIHSKSRTRKEIISYNYGKVGHIKMNCIFLKREYSTKKR